MRVYGCSVTLFSTKSQKHRHQVGNEKPVYNVAISSEREMQSAKIISPFLEVISELNLESQIWIPDSYLD